MPKFDEMFVLSPARAAAVLTGLVVATVMAFPSGDGSYECNVPPAWLLLAPAKEDSAAHRADFFDEGFQCNHDARARGVLALRYLAVGGAVTVGLRQWRRRGG